MDTKLVKYYIRDLGFNYSINQVPNRTSIVTQFLVFLSFWNVEVCPIWLS